jgi:hypothetical protein
MYANPRKRSRRRRRTTRTLAQRAATRRLVALNRSRRGGGRRGARRSVRRYAGIATFSGPRGYYPPSRIPVDYRSGTGTYPNPRRRRKARRSPAQKAATRRLIALNRKRARGGSRRRRNPLYLGKQTAVGTRLTGRMIRVKGSRRRLARGRVDAWRMENVLGRSYRVPRGFSRKAHRRPRKARTAAQKRATARLIAWNRRHR